jgi:FHA domain-containing protein/IPT/TIG domain-containing protein
MSSSSSVPSLPTLIVTGGSSDGLQIPLEAPGAEKIIGSGPTSHVRLTSRNVDASHARISWEDATVVLSDEGSAAGTFVNGEKVGTGHVLADGDRISIGPPGSPESVKLLVRVPGDLAALAARPGGLPRPAAPAPAFTVPEEEDPLVFSDPAVPDKFTPAFAPPTAQPPVGGPAIIVDDSPPAPPPPAAPAAASAAAPPPPAGPVRTPRASTPAARPDYMTDVPSISGGDRVRGALEVPAEAPAARPAPTARGKRRRPGLPAIPRAAIVAVGAAALTAGAFYMYSHSRLPPPVLASVTPPKAEIGSTITINGSGFEDSASDNTVRFGDTVAKVTNASATSLAVTVPDVAVPAAKGIAITVDGKGGRSNALFVKIARLPRITRVEPDVALPGTEVTLHGQNFDGGPVTVRIGGEKVQVKNAAAGSLQVRVPETAGSDGQSVSVTVELGTDTARAMPLLLGRLPLVLDVAPAYGTIGQRVTIKGRGFDPVATGNRVTIGGTPALVLAASPTELQVAAPAAPTTGSQEALPLIVESRGAASSGRATFALAHPLSGNARLRFYPAPVPTGPPDRYALVSTEMGPVLLLTGKGDAGTTSERADRVATALTALMESATSRAVTLETREGGAPSVAVAGGPVLLSATPDDVEGYAQAWDAGAKPGRSTPRQIAGYWTALLQDYMTLFGQGQRPSRTAELTPRGKVLVDLYAEAQRRGASGGVPVGTLYDLSPAALKSVRDMALLVPSGGPTAAGTAVAGRWEGTMADADGERRIEMLFQVDGGRLSGSLTTKTGGIAVRTPLQQVTYEKGALRFLLASGGGTRQFRGALEGGTLAGSIFKDAAAKDAVGRFSVRYVE